MSAGHSYQGHTMKLHKIHKGFTLIELLVVIVIIGLLVAIGYPSYQDNITNSRRADAKAALTGFAQALERFYTTDGTYAGAATGGADTGSPAIYSATSPLDSVDVYYDLSIYSADASSYVIVATPANAQDGDGSLILKSTGAKGWDSDDSGLSAGAVDNDEECWETSC